MTETKTHFDPPLEDFLAELTAAAYRVSLCHRVKGSFIDLELGLWRELRAVLRQQLLTVDSPLDAGDRDAARAESVQSILPERPKLMGPVARPA
jgi:hypothetical protein